MRWLVLPALAARGAAFGRGGDNRGQRRSALRAAARADVAAPPRVVVDLDVVADTLPLESEVYLSTLQTLRPDGPWAALTELPGHKWRTFDLALKFRRVLREKRVVRPADATMILRLLFEEDEVGKRARAAREDPSGKKWEGGGWAPTSGPLAGVRPGTRPLTAGEVVENWDEVLHARCKATWLAEEPDFAGRDIDAAVAREAARRLEKAADSVSDALAWRPDALRALKAAQRAGRVHGGAPLVLVRHDLLGLNAADADAGRVLAGWRAVVDSQLPGADVAFLRGAVDVAEELTLYSQQTLYYGGSPQLTMQLGAALRDEVQERAAGLHLCEWVERWREPGAPPPMPFDIISLGDEHRDFRQALGVSLRPRGAE